MGKTLLVMGALVAGLVGGYVFWALALYIGGEMLGVSQFEGAYAMGVAFFWAPLLAIATGLGAMVLTLRWANRRQSATTSD